MPGWAWVLIAVGVIVVIALVVWQALRARRSRTLQERFGPEYGRTVERADDRREAEAELAARARRRDELEIRPLPSAARERYLQEWRQVQARFVDDPGGAVEEADTLIQSVMRERGYPVEDFEQRAADVSVDHPQVVENYRSGHRLARSGDTEDQRQAMVHLRSLFEELVEETSDRPLARDTDRTTNEEAVR
jgi:FtsZ-interacting cell division protein ZipA